MIRKSAEEIPSTSELGSSPGSPIVQRGLVGQDSGLVVVITPQKSVSRVKQEEGSEGTVTPGGSLRRCGQEGFICRRIFCFKCRSGKGVVG